MTPTVRFTFSRLQHALSLSFGCGLSPYAPGTVGALAGLPLHFVLAPLGPLWESVILLQLFVLGVWACHKTGEALGEPDHGAIVWDETWGMALVLAWAPGGYLWWPLAFVLFRFFDITKPWPVNLPNDHMENGLGVMLDDALAAFYAVAVLWAANFAFERLF